MSVERSPAGACVRGDVRSIRISSSTLVAWLGVRLDMVFFGFCKRKREERTLQWTTEDCMSLLITVA